MGQEMVGQQYGLGPLEVGVAGQIGGVGLVGPGQQYLLEATTSPATAVSSRLA